MKYMLIFKVKNIHFKLILKVKNIHFNSKMASPPTSYDVTIVTYSYQTCVKMCFKGYAYSYGKRQVQIKNRLEQIQSLAYYFP